MQITQIIAGLNSDVSLPIDAIAAANVRRDEAAPAFIKEIEQFLATPGKARRHMPAIFFMVHLLGVWREKAAYRPVAALFRLPPDELEALLGDAVSTTSHKIMAGIFDRDPEPVRQIILDRGADEMMRSRMCNALAMVTLQGELALARSAEILRACATELKPQAVNQVWHGWQNAIAMLGLEELSPLVEKAFAHGFVDPELGSFRQFQADLQLMKTHPGTRPALNDDQYAPLGNVIEELSRWDQFSGR